MWLKKVDHLTFATKNIKKLAWIFIEILGGKLVERWDDVYPKNSKSSMKLWCIDFKNFGIALVEGIDRQEKSQVTLFVERHGDNFIQHPAFAVDDLEKFLEHAEKRGLKLRGSVLIRNDGFGLVKQVFAKGFQEMADPAEASFPEFVERPKKGKKKGTITFSQKFGENLYAQIESASKNKDTEDLFDFSLMSKDWEPGYPKAKILKRNGGKK